MLWEVFVHFKTRLHPPDNLVSDKISYSQQRFLSCKKVYKTFGLYYKPFHICDNINY